MRFLVVVGLLCLAKLGGATQVKGCSTLAKEIPDLDERVTIGNCKKPPCRLRKDSVVAVTLKFKPEFDVDDVTLTVNANILSIPFPFPGTDGTSACDKIFEEDGTTKAGCALKAGKEYVFKSSIEVLQIYPRVKTVVHWGLTSPKGDVICFEVPARITN